MKPLPPDWWDPLKFAYGVDLVFALKDSSFRTKHIAKELIKYADTDNESEAWNVIKRFFQDFVKEHSKKQLIDVIQLAIDRHNDYKKSGRMAEDMKNFLLEFPSSKDWKNRVNREREANLHRFMKLAKEL